MHGGNVCEANKRGPSPAGKGGLPRRGKTDEVEAFPVLPFSVIHPKSPMPHSRGGGRYFLSPKSNQKGPLIPGQRTHGLRGL